jgi:hypothetical protein
MYVVALLYRIRPFQSLDSSVLGYCIAMEAKKSASDEILQWLKTSQARSLRLPAGCASRSDVMETLANNRSIITLDLSDCEVCIIIT